MDLVNIEVIDDAKKLIDFLLDSMKGYPGAEFLGEIHPMAIFLKRHFYSDSEGALTEAGEMPNKNNTFWGVEAIDNLSRYISLLIEKYTELIGDGTANDEQLLRFAAKLIACHCTPLLVLLIISFGRTKIAYYLLMVYCRNNKKMSEIIDECYKYKGHPLCIEVERIYLFFKDLDRYKIYAMLCDHIADREILTFEEDNDEQK